MITYQDAGVDIQKGTDAVSRIKKHVATTYNKHVLTHIGGFGSAFSIKDIVNQYQHPVLVQSMDGVGTKTIVARMANQFYGLGHDLLSACANDIVVMGAKPLTLLDYLASANLDGDVIESMIHGLSDACKENDVALVGGEMAQMPDTYLQNEWDFVGIVTGIVEKDRIITGEKIQAGDVVIAFTSNGLHTNGFSLARKLLFETAKIDIKDVSHDLLTPHINYTKPVHDLLNHQIDIHGMAHITGGGIWDNIPRVLPENVSVEIQKNSWPMPSIFKKLVEIGNLDEQTAYHTFNMGIGLVMILSEKEWEKARPILNHYKNFQACRVGTVVLGDQTVRLI